MTTVDAPEHEMAPRGELRFVDPSTLAQLRGAASAASMLYAEMPFLSAALRGQLGEFIEAAIEEELTRLGAPRASSSAPSDFAQLLADQLGRAQGAGLRGLVVVVGPLQAVASGSGVLDADDSAALRAWVAATQRLPVTLLLDRRNLTLAGYGAPQRLDTLLGWSEPPERTRRPKPAPKADKNEAMKAEAARAEAARAEAARAEAARAEAARAETAKPCASAEAPKAEAASRAEAARAEAPRGKAASADRKPSSAEGARAEAPRGATEPPPRAEVVRADPTAAPPRVAPHEATEAESIDTHLYAEELHAARGPKPLGVVERMFITRYVPLAEAERRGQLDTFARQVRADWAASFARSYTEAFQALRVTGKRPAMVFDVPQLAARIARLHGARSIELLLVDGLRYDLGLRVQERLGRALEGKAACAETMLLWSALPSTTATQLDLLAHGLEALNRPLPVEDPDALSVARGRNVAMPRRVKVGQRDLVKIDAVEARLREAGPPLGERLDSIADEVALAVTRHAETLPERTLLVVFGDHGFTIEAGPGGSGPARQGGASPEEVLVPGFAWLLGGVH